jgi:hypothetical protein
MPLTVPVLDDRTFEQLLAEAKRRIPSFTPEWTNFGLDSDPGITLVQVFAFLTDALLYRANRYPETNHLKFLQLLGIPLRPAAAAQGMVTIHNVSGPVAPLLLEPGIQLGAGNVDFATQDPLTVLPIEPAVFYKRQIKTTDPDFATFQAQHEAIALAAAAAQDSTNPSTAGGSSTPPQLVFYETVGVTGPTATDPNPSVNLASDTMDKALWIALLAPPNVTGDRVRGAIGNQTLSLGFVPAATGTVAPLKPLQFSVGPAPTIPLVFEMPANPGVDIPAAQWLMLAPIAAPNVLDAPGVVQLSLPAPDRIGAWTFTDPLSDGIEDFPPRIEDATLTARIVTWVRARLAAPTQSVAEGGTPPSAAFTWVGTNATTIVQATSVVNEVLGNATGEPDQQYTLANAPILPNSISVMTVDMTGSVPMLARWALTDDLLAAGPQDQVFSLDAEAATIRFGDGLRGARPPAGARIQASYRYGGGRQGNVGIGAVSASRDPRLQAGFRIENPVPTFGGDLGQTAAQAEADIPLVLRHGSRLVTAQDFADIAMQTPGVDVNRVDVLPLFQPGPPGKDGIPGVVTLMVVPDFDPVSTYWPTPDRHFLTLVCNYLDPRRLVTTEVYVRGPEYVDVNVSVGIQVQGGFYTDLVNQAVRDRLNTYLSSRVGLGPAGAGWPLRKRLLAKDIEAAVTRVEGVEFVNALLLGTDAVARDFVDMAGLQLPMLVRLSVVSGDPLPLDQLIGAVVQPSTPGVQIVPVPVVRKKC